MGDWAPVKERDRLGIALYNYLVQEDNYLQVYIGDKVHIFEECQDWYFGGLVRNTGIRGIVPKGYIKILTEADQHGGAVVKESTAMLREWGRMLRDIYVKRDTSIFRGINAFAEIIADQIGFRASLICGKLPAEEVRDLRTKLTKQMDVLNHLLHLDLVVRDQDEKILDPERTSAVELFRQHTLSSERRLKHNMVPSTKSNSYMLLLSVKNFTWKRSEDMELFISVFMTGNSTNEQKAPRPLCENYVIKWTRQGMAKDLDQLNNFRVVFTDLNKEDVARSEGRVWLVCNVVGDGNYQALASEFQINKSFSRTDITVKSSLSFRKPLGVAATEVSDYFNQTNKNISDSGDKEFMIPFLPSGSDAETLENTFRKLTSEKREGLKVQGPGLWVSLKVLQGDLTSMQEGSKSHLVVGRPCIARKIGFPELILPNDVRNDLYVNLYSGELSRLNKTADRNVEVVIEAVDEAGALLPEAISPGASATLTSEFSTVVYYHEGKPRWNEVVRVVVPVELYNQVHLRFTFKHRSRNEAKERTGPAPWALAYLKLVNDSNGTTVKDGYHELHVYKIDKKFDMSNPTYLDLPSIKHNLSPKVKFLSYNNGLTCITKDVLTVFTTLCSTKLTQNLGLLSLLKWRSEPDNLKHNLNVFISEVKAAEVVKFLPDVLDALFSILMENSDSELYDNLVFEALIAVIEMVTGDKFKQFIPVLEVYINENYSATLAYNKLLVVFKDYVEAATGNRTSSTLPISALETKRKTEKLAQATNSLQFLFKFVVRSRMLFSALNGGKGAEPFESMLKEVLFSLVKLMFGSQPELQRIQESCLKHIVLAVPDLIQVFPRRQLAEILMKMISSLPSGQLTEQKLSTLRDLVHSRLFLHADCRQVILPVLSACIEIVLTKPGSSLAGKATEALGDCLDKLFKAELYLTNSEDISTIINHLLRTVVQSVANRSCDDKRSPAVVTNMISIFRLMSPNHFSSYIQGFMPETEAGRQNLLDFVMEVLLMFKDLIKHNIYPRDWAEMTMLMNSVVLNALRQLSHTIRDFFSVYFEHDAWNNFFQCSISFLTQESLQVEEFSQMKRAKILATYGDMRKQMGLEIKTMWFNLGQHKHKFIPSMVGNFLEMTLIPDIDLRNATIPIFFDMMQCEFYSGATRHGSRLSLNSISSETSERATHKANFKDFENEMISQLDHMVMEGGKGDGMYKDKFRDILMGQCEQHMALKELGTVFVSTVTRLMELLLEYRSIRQEESRDNQMSCIVNLLEFYNTHKREEMFIRHLKKLYDLHMECENWAEAAFTLDKQANMLRWTEETLSSRFLHSKYIECKIHRELKIALYVEMIDLFDKGQMWEQALEHCRELAVQYEEELVDFYAMSRLRTQEAGFYDNIMHRLRPEPEYFRVAFYGRSFPAFLQNKVFVYRGKGFERLPEFQSRILDQFPTAELMTKLGAPTDVEMDQPGQLIQINKVEPIMLVPKRLHGKTVDQQILNYYKVNEVTQFMYSRPFKRASGGGTSEEENEFACLWIERTILRTSHQLPGILRWFPVINTEVFELSPLENAIETMQNINRDLRNILQEHILSNSPVPLKPLSMKLNGIIDAAVMGGTAMYEKAFFSDDFRSANPEQRENLVMLENLMAEQIPLLEVGITIHEAKRPEELRPLHERLTIMFKQMKEHVESKYGRRSLGPEFKMRNPRRHSASRGSTAGGTSTWTASTAAAAGRSSVDHRPSVDSSRLNESGDSTPATKSKSNLMANFKVNRKRSRASEDRISLPRPNQIRSIPENEDGSSSGSALSRLRNSVTVPLDGLNNANQYHGHRPSSPATQSNRDSVISASSAGSDSAPPPPSLPPKYSIGSSSPVPSRFLNITEEESSSSLDLETLSIDSRYSTPPVQPKVSPPYPTASSKKKPAPPPPIACTTPPAPPKKAPLRLPLQNI